MSSLLRRGAHGLCMPSSSFYMSRLVDRSLLSKSSTLPRIVHAQFVKAGLINNTFWVNRCLQLYFKSAAVIDAFRLFNDSPHKNTISWNICLKGSLENGDLSHALNLFDEMPEPDVVSWNTMISGSGSYGFPEYSIRIFLDMQSSGLHPTEFTFSILASLVSCVHHGEQIHCNAICSGVNRSNLVVWNSLMDMYRRLQVFDYALSMFITIEDRDIFSWNSLILSCSDSGAKELALDQVCVMMRELGIRPDEYTVSTVVSICSDLRDLCKGEQAFALCVKMGFLSNSSVSGAAIVMFSKCNRVESSLKVFKQLEKWNSLLCNSLLAAYSWHGFGEDALKLFILAMRHGVRPDEFTFSTVLSSMNVVMLDHGAQVHSLINKLGFDQDTAVATSLMEMYFKTGSVDTAMSVFAKTDGKDLIFWNTVILGLARNNKAAESIAIFQRLVMDRRIKPDRVTVMGVLVACCYAGFVNEGISIFSSMEKAYGVNPGDEHYACLIELLCRVGMIDEAKDIAETMPSKPNSHIWELILCASLGLGDKRLAETAAKRMLESGSKSCFPYEVLIKLYEMAWRWESSVKVRYAMKQHKLKPAQGLSKIGMKGTVHSFKADQLQIHGGHDTCAVLDLLSWDSDDQKINWSADVFF